MAEKKKATFDPEVKKDTPEEEKGEGKKEDLPKKDASETKTESSKEEEGDEGDEKKEEKDVAPENIPVRKSIQQQIIGRQKRTIKKLRKKKEKDTDTTEEEEEEEEEELSPEAETAVEKAVSRKIAPVLDAVVSTRDEQELKDLYVDEPIAKKYDKRIRAYMANKHWKGVPVVAIFRYLAFENAQAIGKERKRIADKETDLTKGGGRTLSPKKPFSPGGIPSPEEMMDMPKEDFEKLQRKAKQGKFLKT